MADIQGLQTVVIAEQLLQIGVDLYAGQLVIGTVHLLELGKAAQIQFPQLIIFYEDNLYVLEIGNAGQVLQHPTSTRSRSVASQLQFNDRPTLLLRQNTIMISVHSLYKLQKNRVREIFCCHRHIIRHRCHHNSAALQGDLQGDGCLGYPARSQLRRQ